jgi:hypothetical protein
MMAEKRPYSSVSKARNEPLSASEQALPLSLDTFRKIWWNFHLLISRPEHIKLVELTTEGKTL